MNRPRAIAANIFAGVIDLDSDPRTISNADYTDATDIYNGYGSQVGAVIFKKGNALISYTLPDTGTNKCLGSFEDKQTGQLIIFLYNNLGAHSILAWRPKDTLGSVRTLATGSGLNFSGRLISHAPTVDGKLLYWTDANSYKGFIYGSPPSELDMLAGDNYLKNYEFEIYAGQPDEGQFMAGATYKFFITDGFTQTVITTFTADGSFENDPEAGLQWLYESIKASLLNNYILRIEYCDCKVTVVLNNAPNGYNILGLEMSDNDIRLVGINHYPVIQPYHIDLVKQPAHCAPSAEYVTSDLATNNNVLSLCAQFRVRYIYRGGTRSAWSPISNIALNTDFDGEPISVLNAIRVDFTDDRLSDPSWLFLIRYVEVAFRDGNTNVFQLIDRFDVCKIGIKKQFITFLNDKLYQVLESDDVSTSVETQVLKLFDSVPLLTGTMAMTADSNGNNLLFLGANLESYDCPACLEMDVEPTPFVEECLIDITGTIDVINNDAYPSADIDFSAYPLGGFVVYLAGTNYFGVSNSPVDGSGTNRFTIPKVPKGHYILRVASYKCSYTNDLGVRYNLANGLEWQRTSSPVIDCAGAVANDMSQWERQIDLSTQTLEFNLDVEPGYGPILILNAHWSKRVTEVANGEQAMNMYEMYVLDNDAQNSSAADRIGAINVERQQIHFNSNALANLINDANGYAYKMERYTKGSLALDILITVENMATRKVYRGDYAELYGDTLTDVTTGVFQSGGGGNLFIINTDEDFTQRKRAVQFKAEDQDGLPLEGVLFTVTRCGRSDISGPEGTAQIVLYAEWDNDDRTDDLVNVIYRNDTCYEHYPENPLYLFLEIVALGDNPPPYIYPIPFVFTFSGGIVVNTRYLKAGGVYDWGVVYEDRANRTCGVVKGTRLHVPFHVGGLTRYQAIWSIRSLPPIWATHYRIVRTRNALHQQFVQWAVKEVLYMRIPSILEAPIPTTYANGDYTHIMLRLFIPPVSEMGPQLTFFWQQDGQQGYTPVEGDFVRLILNNAGTSLSTATQLFQAPIVGIYVDAEKIYAVIPAVFGTLEIKPDFLIEYMTPRTNLEEVYYEGGEDCYDIGNPGLNERYHKGPIQDQDPTEGGQPATGIATGGDTYWRRQLYTESSAFITEHYSPTRLVTTACEDIGRAFVYDPNAGQIFLYNGIRFSGKYVPNSQVNDLPSFGALDFQLINRQWGIIKWLGFANNVLLAVCQFKVQPVYVNKGQLLELSGDISVGRSDRTLNIADESVTDYGTHNPTSIIQEGTYVYGWDGYQGVVWRYSQAGVQPITTKMVRYWRDMGQARPDLELDVVLGGYDRRHLQYLLTFAVPGKVSAVTWAYDEAKGGWTNRHSFVPEMYGRVGQELVSFVLGAMWKHFENTLYANYYGIQQRPSITFVVNADPAAIKLFYSMRILSSKLWAAPTILLPSNTTYLAGMLSRLKANKFQRYEGEQSADFMRDMLDTSPEYLAIANQTIRRATALLSGRRLRGEVMTITIQVENGSIPTTLERVDVYYINSEETNG